MARTITITEALAELKTIDKRVDVKVAAIVTHSTRPSGLIDPYEKEGGSQAFVASTLQAYHDLLRNRERIRSAIMESNLKAQLTIEGETRSVFGWLVWRKEIAPKEKQLITQVLQKVLLDRSKAATWTKDQKDVQLNLAVNVPESDLQKRAEQIEKVLGDLDGKLSLFNATTTVEIA